MLIVIYSLVWFVKYVDYPILKFLTFHLISFILDVDELVTLSICSPQCFLLHSISWVADSIIFAFDGRLNFPATNLAAALVSSSENGRKGPHGTILPICTNVQCANIGGNMCLKSLGFTHDSAKNN